MSQDYLSQDFFARGAEAKLYDSSLLGSPVLIKERTAKRYRTASLDKSIRKSRAKNESRIMLKALAAGINVPKILSVGKFNIYMEKLQGKRLREAKLSKIDKKKIFKEIGRILSDMHAAGITHGDFTPANIMLCRNKIYLIDFGLAALSNELEEKAVDVLLMEKNISNKEFSYFLIGYKKNKEWKKVLNRTQEIKKRGRYQIRAEENIEEKDE